MTKFDKYLSLGIATLSGVLFIQSIFLGIVTLLFALVIANSKLFF